MKKYFFLILTIFLAFPFIVKAATVAQKFEGKILLNPFDSSTYWQVKNGKKVLLGNFDEAVKSIGTTLTPISEDVIQKIADIAMPIKGDVTLAKKFAGKILISEIKREVWQIDNKLLKKKYLGIERDYKPNNNFGEKINYEEFAKIHKPGMNESINQYSSYEQKTVKLSNNRQFKLDIVTIDLSNPKLKIITDTADNYNCKKNCKAKTLAQYVYENKAFAGINATYFEDSNGAKKNYYFFPVYNTKEDKLINEDQLKYWTTGPIMAFDQNNKFYYFKDSREFKSLAYFEKTNNTKLVAALGNRPRLIEDSMNLLIDWDIDNGQRTVKTLRNALGYKDNKLYLIVARSSTLPDLAEICQELGMTYALNLDGGYSTALYYNNEYMLGPGRNIPNVLLFKEVN